MKKFLALFLAVAMLAVFCACGSTSTSSGSDPSSSVSAPSEDEIKTSEDGTKHYGVELKELDIATLAQSVPTCGYGYETLPEIFDNELYSLYDATFFAEVSCYMSIALRYVIPEGMTYDEAYDNGSLSACPLFAIVFKNDLSEIDSNFIDTMLSAYGLAGESREAITTDDGGICYCITFDLSSQDIPADLKAELVESQMLSKDVADNLVVFKKQLPTLSFTTTDMNGKTVTSEELFAGKEITMINFFTSWCSACAAEMSELLELYKSLESTDKQLILCMCDAASTDDETFKEGMQMIENNGGAGLYIICNSDELNALIDKDISAYPTNYLVDSTGKVLTNYSTCDRTPEAFNAWIESYIK